MSTRTFLDALFPADTPGVVEVRSLPSGRRTWATPGDWRTVGPFLTTEVNQQGNLFVGVATRRDATTGTAANLCALPMVWVDFDVDPAQVTTRLCGFPFPPALIVHSGLGVHVYWRLRGEPLDVQTVAGLTRAGSILRRLAAYFGGDDRACDPARVLRIVGTFNTKYDEPRRVTLAHHATVDVNLDELADHLPREVVRRNQLVLESSITPGTRNDVLYTLTRTLRARGLPVAAIVQTVEGVNQTQCQPPLDARELAGLLRNALAQPDRATYEPPASPITIVHDVASSGNGHGTPIDDFGAGCVVNLATVTAEDVDWVWPNYLPRRKGVVLAGDPGRGKSMISLDLAARVTRGLSWPTGEPATAGRVLLLIAEDGLADTVRPRLDAAGGDASQVDVLTAVRDAGHERFIDLARDRVVLEQTLARTRPALVIVDPLNAYLGATDSHRDADVRGVLAPLLALADQYACCLLWIAHLSKATERRALYRPGASIAFVAAARVVLIVGEHPGEPDVSVLAMPKNNVAPLATSLAYRVDTGRVLWQGPVSCTADSILADAPRDTAIGPAQELLTQLREDAIDGRIDVDEAFARAELLDIPRRTLQHAVRRAGLISCCTGRGPTRQTVWIDPLNVHGAK